MKIVKNKIMAITVAILLITLMGTSFMVALPVKAALPSLTYSATYAFIDVSPNPWELVNQHSLMHG
jgi:uncharacterized membrane protein YadS